jgi:hypothetical protein
MTIASLKDLCEYIGADGPEGLNRRLYKDTECGAWISVQTPDGVWHHCGQDWSGVREVVAFKIGGIVEGSDAEIEGDPFVLPVEEEYVDAWIAEVEDQAEELWREANVWEDE